MTADAAYLDRAEPVDPRFAAVDCVFFVIGAQKAGTTWLSKYFASHPEISVPEWKEHDYWNMVEGRARPSRMLRTQMERRARPSPLRTLAAALPFTLHARRQRAITLALAAVEAPFPPYSAYADVILENVGPKTRAAGEICPEYAALDAETYRRMAGLSPNVRFIFLMRDPVSRFISGVRHSLRKTLGRDAAREADLSEALTRFATTPDSRPYRLSDYARTITTLERSVPEEHVLYVFFEDLFDQATVRTICDFLQVTFVPGDIRRRRNDARSGSAAVREEDRAMVARGLKPVYEFVFGRFGDAVPQKWRESAALC